MKIIDKKGRLFEKINVVDIAVILLLIFAIAAVGIKFRQVKTTQGGDKTIEYTMVVERLRQPSVDAIESEYTGIQDAETKKDLGEIISIRKAPARELVKLASGEYTFAEYDDKYDLTITLRTKGSETPQGFYSASGKLLMVGDTLGISNGHAQTFGEVLSVEVIEKQ